ncbi:hypothetical protein ACFLVP_00250 [Chloroflexota bacterium]
MSAITEGSRGYIFNNSNPQELARALLYISNEFTKELPCFETEFPVEAQGYIGAKEYKEIVDNDLSKREEEVLKIVSK